MMFTRAFVFEDEMPFERMRASMRRRLGFLVRKLVDDLTQGAKIFVFRLTDRILTEPELDRLHAAMRAYGDNMLLYVRHEDAAHPSGVVELVRPGLMVGYIDRFKMSSGGVLSSTPPTASWLAICRAAHAIWREA